MNDSALDILAGTFKKQETLTDANTYTFESKITTGQTQEGGNAFVGLLSDFRLTKTARYLNEFTLPTEPLWL